MKASTTSLLCALALAGAARAAAPAAPPTAAPGPADWRTPDPANVLIIDTTKGRIIAELSPLAAPKAVARVRQLARSGFYDGRTFFRVVDGFMDQTGDPKENGTGGSDQPNLPAEFTFRRDGGSGMVTVSNERGVETGLIGALPVAGQTLDLAGLTVDGKVNAWGMFCPGVLGMARTEEFDSANSQFFLMRATGEGLDQKYTAFGRAIVGLDVIGAMKLGEPPSDPDKMTKVSVLADLPAAQRPNIRIADPARGTWFQAALERAKAQKVVGVSACDIDIPVEVK
jgi:peptidylprolyl isomerase